MAGYTRQSTASIINGENITAPPLTAEFNQLAAAFNLSTGHSHDGTTGNAPKIELSTSATGFLPINSGGTGGRNNFSATRVPGVGDDTADGYAIGSVWYFIADDRYFVCMYADSGAAVWLENRFINSNGDFRPHDGEVADLGSAAHKWRDALLSRDVDVGRNLNVTTNTGVGGTLVVTGATTLAATSATSLSVSGTSTLAAVDINNGNIDNTQIGAANPSTGAFTSLTASGTSTLTTVDINNGTIDNTVIGGTSAAPASFTTINATGNITGNLVGNVTGNITASGSSTLNNLTVNGTMDVTNTQIANVSTPTNASHAANKSYVDAQINNLIGGAPSTLDTLNEIADALNDDANVYNTLDTKIDTKLSKAGDTMSGDLAMGANKVTGLATPTTGTDAVNLTYVTNLFGSTSSAASSASAAATSESNAATSATAAAASYDSFDDRYLGPKTGTLPSVDNDGNALVVGALVFDATNNVMKVWNGSEFQAASSSIDGIKSNFKYTATANQTSFLGADADGNTLVIDNADLVNVFMNGVRLIGGGSDYTASANVNTVTLTAGAAASDVIEIEVFGNFTGQAGSAVSITGGSVSGLTSLGVAGDATFGDNNKAIFGAGSDLQIYHDGTRNYIDSDTTELRLQTSELRMVNSANTEVGLKAVEDGAVTLYYDANPKLATTSTGVDVTGVFSSNKVTIDNGLADGGELLLASQGYNSWQLDNSAGSARFIYDGKVPYQINGVGDAQIWRSTTSANTEYMRLHSGTLLVGKDTDDQTTPGLVVGGNGHTKIVRASATANVNDVLQLNRLTTDGDILTFKQDGVAVATIGVNSNDNIYFAGEAGNTAGIYLNNVALLPADTGGTPVDDHVNLGTASNRWSNLYLAGGVAFGDAGGSGTSTSNLLDSYEEGTWNLGVGTSGITLISASTTSGRYTKIGNSVTVHCLVTPSSATSSNANFDITGLPFGASGASGIGSVMSQYVQDSGQQIVCFVPSGTSTLRFYETDSGAWNRLKHSDITLASDLYVTVTYMTS